MKKILLSFLSIVTILFIIFFFNKNFKKNKFPNGDIKIFCWGEYISDGTDGSDNVLKEFEKKNKIKISSFNTFESCEQMYAKLKNGNSKYDIVFCCDYMVKQLIDEGLLFKINTKKLKNYCNILEEYTGKNWGFDENNEYSVPYCWGHIALIYNKKLIEQLTGKKAENVVNSWQALWNEQLKHQILMFINSRDSFSITHKFLNNSINTTNKTEIFKAADLLKKQKHLVQAYVMDEMFDKMENNEAAISVAYSGDIINMIKNNKNLKYCFPKEGSNIFIDTVCIPANAKNKENALKFIDFLCEGEVALKNAKFISYSTPNKKAWEKLPNSLKYNEIAYPPKEIIKKCEINMPLSKKINILKEELWFKIKS